MLSREAVGPPTEHWLGKVGVRQERKASDWGLKPWLPACLSWRVPPSPRPRSPPRTAPSQHQHVGPRERGLNPSPCCCPSNGLGPKVPSRLRKVWVSEGSARAGEVGGAAVLLRGSGAWPSLTGSALSSPAPPAVIMTHRQALEVMVTLMCWAFGVPPGTSHWPGFRMRNP